MKHSSSILYQIGRRRARGRKEAAYNTPFFRPGFSSRSSWAEIGKLLIDNGADLNSQGIDDNTPLHNAVITDNAEFVQLLINEGAELNQKNVEGRTPLELAVLRGLDDVAEVLREAGAK